MKSLIKLKQRVLDVIDKTSIHGLPKFVFNRNYVMRVVWLVCFLSAFGYSSYLVIVSIMNYLQYDVLFSTELVNNDEAEFPAISFCDQATVNFENQSFQRLIEKSDFPLGINLTLIETLTRFNRTLDDLNNPFLEICTGLNEKYKTPNYKQFGYNLNEMLISCRFDNLNCNSSYFTKFTNKNFGNCYSFNTGKYSDTNASYSLNVKKTGFNNGLKLELFTGNPSRMPFWVFNVGAIVGIHNKSTVPLFTEEGIKLKPGEETILLFNKFQFNRLSSPYSDCVMDVFNKFAVNTFEYRDTFTISKSYRQNLCIQRCTSQLIPVNKPASANLLWNNLTILQTTDGYKKCLNKCPPECLQTSYEPVLSFSQYPAVNYAKSLLPTNRYLRSLNMTIRELKSSILSLRVNFRSFTTTVIYETPAMSFTSLLANIGGQLGLFLGMSFLSFMEILEVFFIIFRCSFFSTVHSIQKKTNTKNTIKKSTVTNQNTNE